LKKILTFHFEYQKQQVNNMSYIRKMLERDKNEKLTVGYRAAFKASSGWAEHFEEGRQLLLSARDNEEFNALVLRKNFTGEITRDLSICVDEVAWIREDELILVDKEVAKNLDFIDWYAEVAEDMCPHCRKHVVEYEKKCPGCNKYNPYHGVSKDGRTEEE